MAYSRAEQVAAAVEVLCWRMNAELHDRKTPRLYRDWLVQARKSQIDWRKLLVGDALDRINDTVVAATEDDQVRASSTKSTITKLHSVLRRAAILTATLPDTVQPSFNGLADILRAADAWSRKPSQRKKRAGHRQREAVQEAAFLIGVTNELPMTVTRGGQWYRLSAILYGKKNADLFNYMIRHKKLYGGFYKNF